MALLLVVIGLLIHYRTDWSLHPWKREAAFSNLSRVVAGGSGALYTVTDSKQTLRKTDGTGQLVYAVSSTQGQTPGTMQLFNGVAADSEGNAYALITVLGQYGLKVQGDKIIRISPDGKTIDTLYQSRYTAADNLLRVGEVQSLSIQGKFLYFFKQNKTSASLLRLPENVGSKPVVPQTLAKLQLPDNQYFYELSGNQPAHYFFTSRQGRLYDVQNGTTQKLYPTSDQTQLEFPVHLTTRDQENLYFIDYHQDAVMRLDTGNPGSGAVPVITMSALVKKFPDLNGDDFTDLTVANGTLIVSTSAAVLDFKPDGEFLSMTDQYHYPTRDIAARLGFWLLLVIGGILAGNWIRFLYVRVMKRKIPLLAKYLLVMIPVVLLFMIGLSYTIYISYMGQMRSETKQQLELLAANGKYLIDGSHLERLNSPQDYMSPDYQAVLNHKEGLFTKSGISRDGLYSTLYRYMNGQLYVIMDDDDSVTMFNPFGLTSDDLKVLNQGMIVSGEWQDASGEWLYALGPLYGSDGKIIGIYETGKDMLGLQQSIFKILAKILKIIALIGLILLLVITIVTFFLQSSIRKLRRNVNLIANGEWEVEVDIRSRDEVQDLGDRFNLMARSIRRYIQEITKLSSSYFRFVPQPFLRVLGKTNMTEVELGDQVNQPMTILVCSLRGFTQLSAKMDAEENFRFINSFLSVFSPIIHQSNGFTSRYLGPGMLSLFPDQPTDAIRASLQLRQALKSYNDGRAKAGYEPIDIGIALHTGSVMLGIIGEAQRMEGTVVSGHVQLAQDLERISEKLGAGILLTEETRNACQSKLPGEIRHLGSFQLSDVQSPVQLYDLFAGDEEHIRQMKLETKIKFEEGVELYQQGRFYDAREAFVSVVRQNRYDLAAKLYFYACDQYYQEGVTAQWNNALKIS